MAGLTIALGTSAEPGPQTPHIGAGKHWLAVKATITNSTDATLAVDLRHSFPTLRNARGTAVLAAEASLDVTGAANQHGEIDITTGVRRPAGYSAGTANTSNRSPSLSAPSMLPGGVARFSTWYELPANAGPLTWTWSAGKGRTVVFDLR